MRAGLVSVGQKYRRGHCAASSCSTVPAGCAALPVRLGSLERRGSSGIDAAGPEPGPLELRFPAGTSRPVVLRLCARPSRRVPSQTRARRPALVIEVGASPRSCSVGTSGGALPTSLRRRAPHAWSPSGDLGARGKPLLERHGHPPLQLGERTELGGDVEHFHAGMSRSWLIARLALGLPDPPPRRTTVRSRSRPRGRGRRGWPSHRAACGRCALLGCHCVQRKAWRNSIP